MPIAIALSVPLLAVLGSSAAKPQVVDSEIQISNKKALAFEVVSIHKEDPSVDLDGEIKISPDGWHMAHNAMISVLMTAYVPTRDTMLYPVSSLQDVPDWMRTEHYTIDAKVADADRAAWQNPATQQQVLHAMLQTMLADRCKLAVHLGSKEG